MSGIFDELDVPPTLVSFAVAPDQGMPDRAPPRSRRPAARLALLPLPVDDRHPAARLGPGFASCYEQIS